MARYKKTKQKMVESIIKEQRYEKSTQNASAVDRVPPTASNRGKLALRRQKMLQQQKGKRIAGTEPDDRENEESSSQSYDEAEENVNRQVNKDGEEDGNGEEEDGNGEKEDDDGDEEDGNGDEEDVNGDEEVDNVDDDDDNVDEEENEEGKQRIEDESGENEEYIVEEERPISSSKKKSRKQANIDHSECEESEEELVTEVEGGSKKMRGKRARKEASPQPSEVEDQPSLLFAFKYHIASKIWNSTKPRGESRIIKVHSHVGTQKLWDYRNECSFVQNVVVQSGLHRLVLHAHEKLDKVLINAFVERFYPETNTFHLPFGEMAITLDEVVHITGLPAEGRAVTGSLGGSRGITYHDVYKLLDECLGIDKPTAVLVLAGDKKIRLEWLRTQYEGSKESDDDERKIHCSIAFLLYTIGCLVCCDKSGNKVSTHFLQCLKDLKEVGNYSWATACLSWLLHALGQASRKDIHQMTGCMTLLQVWIYEHFPVLRRHNRYVGVDDGEVRAAFYFAKEMSTQLASDLVTLRETIDDLQISDVTWDCFKEKRQLYHFQECSLYNGPIICFETEQLYLPQRFLRQFGFVQPIPTTPFTLNKKTYKSWSRGFKATYNYAGEFGWSEWRNHLLSDNLTSKKAVYPWECDETFLYWYKNASHTLVANPKNRITVPVNANDHRSLLVRIKRRLGHIANFIRSCAPNESLAQVLEQVEKIEEPEPSALFEENMEVEQDDEASKASTGRGKGRRRKKVKVSKKQVASKKKKI